MRVAILGFSFWIVSVVLGAMSWWTTGSGAGLAAVGLAVLLIAAIAIAIADISTIGGKKRFCAFRLALEITAYGLTGVTVVLIFCTEQFQWPLVSLNLAFLSATCLAANAPA
jgi:hypothetical protein